MREDRVHLPVTKTNERAKQGDVEELVKHNATNYGEVEQVSLA
jgi:hypothetical protein